MTSFARSTFYSLLGFKLGIFFAALSFDSGCFELEFEEGGLILEALETYWTIFLFWGVEEVVLFNEEEEVLVFTDWGFDTGILTVAELELVDFNEDDFDSLFPLFD